MSTKKNIILVGSDVPTDWSFKEGLETSTGMKWEVKKCITNNFKGISKITRYIKFFTMPLDLFIHRTNIANILSWQQFFGLTLACYFRLFRVKNAPRLDIMTFIYKPKKGLVGHIFKKFVGFAVTSGYINNIFVYGKSEIKYYSEVFGVSESKFVSVKLGIEDVYDKYENNDENSDIFCIAPGRSNRDYDFLCKAWIKGLGKLLIISDTYKVREKKENIELLSNCFNDNYLNKLSSTKCAVIVPLLNESFSSGQLVFLQAGMFGKPVITTKNATVSDYIVDGVNGFIIDKREDQLLEALVKLSDPQVYRIMSENSRKMFKKEFSLEELGKKVGRILREG
ncbi:MAG: glycosyltransferase [Lachnospiraceae bacterium]|nr:glycosyltransferase [Lachnospiraceae bacterium]